MEFSKNFLTKNDRVEPNNIRKRLKLTLQDKSVTTEKLPQDITDTDNRQEIYCFE